MIGKLPPHPDILREGPELAVLHVLDTALEFAWRALLVRWPGALEPAGPPATALEKRATRLARQCLDLQDSLGRYLRSHARATHRERMAEANTIWDRWDDPRT